MSIRTYWDFELEVQRGGDNKYIARLLHSPAGEATQEFSLPFSAEKIENLVLKLGAGRRSFRKIHSAELEAARELGEKLFESVFRGTLLACFKSSLDEVRKKDDIGLRIKLRLQDVPELADIPWEYLFDASTDRFLAQSNQTPVVRYMTIPEKVPALAIQFPLRILVMVSSPKDYPCLDVNREKANMEQALASLIESGKIQLEFLDNASLIALERKLRKQDCHIFHYIGHGGFDEQKQEGLLVLEDESGRSWHAGADRMATVLRDCRSLRLAVFNTCEGARNSLKDPFAGLATTIVRQGIPAVVGMQFEISDKAAITFSHEFYDAIADGLPVDGALASARKAIYLTPNDVEWGTPVLYMRSPDGALFDINPADQPAMPQTKPTPAPKPVPTTKVKPVPPSRQESTPKVPLTTQASSTKKTEMPPAAASVTLQTIPQPQPSPPKQPQQFITETQSTKDQSPQTFSNPARKEETTNTRTPPNLKVFIVGGIISLLVLVVVFSIFHQKPSPTGSEISQGLPAPGPPPAPLAPAPEAAPAKEQEPVPSADLKTTKEHQDLERKRQEIARMKEQEAQRKQLESERKKLEEERKQLDMAKRPSSSTGNEIKRDGRFVAYDNGTVLDTRTNLMWASKDNGSDINWANAKSYCENYRGCGYTDWRMPTQDELEGLYDGNKSYKATQRDYNVHLTELIQLSACCLWASETRRPDAALFDFSYGYRNWNHQFRAGLYRALPVRSGK